jgi:hypothetical protein
VSGPSTSIDSLYLRGNLFVALPDAVFQLPQIQWINLQVNRLETLAGVGRLTALTTLYVWLTLMAIVGQFLSNDNDLFVPLSFAETVLQYCHARSAT